MDPGARTMTTSGLSVRWSLTAPEEILGLSWNGSPNRTRSWGEFCGETNHEFFGNAWAIESDGSFASLVGMGSAGTWSAPTDRRVAIDSAASGCFGTNGTRVSTTYNFFAGGGAADKLRVQRTFEFGTTTPSTTTCGRTSRVCTRVMLSPPSCIRTHRALPS